MRLASRVLICTLAAFSAACSNDNAAKETVKETLLDPESAQFRNVHDGKARKGGWIVCGEVNAKNRLGGYTGFKRFSTTEKKGDVLIADPATTDGIIAGALIDELCEFPTDGSE